MTDQPPPPQPNPQPQPPTSSSSTSSSKGLVGRVFDLSFSEFITPSIIKLLFVLGIVGAAILALVIFISLANAGGGAVVAGIIVAPIVFAVYVLIARVVCELYLLLFRIEENTRRR